MFSKKILIVSLLFFFVSAFSAPVSIETAEKVAKKHLERKKHGGKIKRARAYRTKTFTPYFVFEKESKGFILVSADNVAVPILGETDSGVFDKDSMPPALVWLLETYEKQIEEAAKSGKTQDSETKALWEQSMLGSEPLMAVSYPTQLLSTTWSQSEPYNLKTPSDGGTRSVTGCVATAMAQIMKYHKYPSRGTGASDAYETETKKISVPSVSFNTSYDYTNMLDNYPYTNSGTAVQREAVSTLMYHAGASVKMDYTNNSSGAFLDYVAPALTQYFGYDNSIRYVYSTASSISASDWKDLVIGQIENNSPVFYGGQNTVGTSGHAFVIDGYDNIIDKFYLNWGWNGNYNGFFELTALNPTNDRKYNARQVMIINIMPNKNGNTPSQIKVSSFNVSTTQTALNASIRAKMNYGADFSGKIGFAVMSGGAVSMVLDSANYSISNTYNQESGRYTVNYTNASLSKLLGTNVPSGNLTLQVVTKRGTGAWTPVGETRSITIKNATYNVTFNASGGTVTPEIGTTSAEGKLASLPVPTRDGYTFNGWFTAVTGGTEVTTSTVFNANTTIYARWTLITYAVTFNANGGSGTTPASIINITPGSTLGTAQMPSTSSFTKSGYVNDGKWYTLGVGEDNILTESFENGTNGWTFVNGSQTNQWIRGTATSKTGSYSAYISNNNSANSYTITSTSVVHLYKDITFPTSSSDFTLTFYFKGGGESNYDDMSVRYSTTSYTPVAGSTFSSGTLLGTSYFNNSSWTQKTITLPAATFSGKTMRLVFSWRNDSSVGTQPPAAIDDINISFSNNTYTEFVFGNGGTPVTANTTLYLKWIPAYTVTFNANGGTVTPLTSTTTPNGTLVSLPVPTRTSYTFNGWFTAVTGGTEVTTSTVFNANTTIYAQWGTLSNIADAIVSVIPNQTWTGSRITPSPSVSINGKDLIEVTDFIYEYDNNTQIGTATLRIVGKGSYFGQAKVVEFTIVAATCGTGFAGGTGITEDDPYIIAEAKNLDAISNCNNSSGKYYKLQNDINLGSYLANTSAGWQPINSFSGKFNGNGHKVSGIWINRPEADDIGLFGRVYGGAIRNVGVKIDDGMGGVVGKISVGGLVGSNFGSTINGSYAMGNVTGTGSNYSYVGGLVGFNSGDISNSYATGNVSGSISSISVGGLVGHNSSGTINNSYATGGVDGGNSVGGLVGENGGTISNSYATGSVEGGNFVGGLVGYNGYNDGGTISNGYATGGVKGGSNVGGLVGGNSATISGSYATGNVSGSYFIGGLIGQSWNGTISNSYYNKQTSGQTDTDKGEGKTTAEMKTKSTYVGWNFQNIWAIDEGKSYPILQWQNPTIPVVPVITISTQPEANTIVKQGSITGSLTVAANVTQNATLSYQWYSNTTNSNTGGTEILGATSANFIIPIILTEGTYYYFCEVRATGATSVRSSVATVEVAVGSVVTYLDEYGNTKSITATSLTGNETTLTSGWYFVQGDITYSSRLAISTIGTGVVNIILMEGSNLNASNGGINVGEGNSLKIYAQSTGVSMGKLTATGGKDQAGIGGNYEEMGGTISIIGGTVTATGGGGDADFFSGNSAAGIGGGSSGAGGTINILGGTVTATGGSADGWVVGGAGIGGGTYSAGGNISISGGTVTATGGDGSAGIGGGYYGAGGVVSISGGMVTANNGFDNRSNITAGIGGGMHSDESGVINSIGGNAVIFASSIQPALPTGGNLGPAIVFNGNEGTMYGNVTLARNITITNNKSLYIGCQTLTIQSGYTLTNNGTIIIADCGNIVGTITGNQPIRPVFTISGGSAYTYIEGVLTITGNGTYTIGMRTGVTSTMAERIVVASGVSANITLSSVNINMSNNNGLSAFDMAGATVNLTLVGMNSFYSGSDRAGIEVPKGATLVITEASTGTLSVTGGTRGAGIGGASRGSVGSISIKGGIVTANGGSLFGGAGIGSGYSATTNGTINISGGTVTATGGTGSAGIGGGESGDGGIINISGGTVTARGGRVSITGNFTTYSVYGGAGIGGGCVGGSGGVINITGGTITATGGATENPGYSSYILMGAAGIGGGSSNGGYGGAGGNINITGGTITATGGVDAAGIGSGYKGSGGTVNINGGMVTATGGGNGQGIGRGIDGSTAGTLAMNGNAIVFASSVGDTDTSRKTRGILFDGNSGMVYGSIELADNLTISSDHSLTVFSNATLIIPSGITLTNNGTITPANGSTINIVGTVNGSNKIIGANTFPSVISKTLTSITLGGTADLLATTGQTVEYAINTANTVPTSGWQTETTFASLNEETIYWIFARSKENTHFAIGTISAGLQISTTIAIPTIADLNFEIPTSHIYNGTTQGIGNVTAKTAGLGTITVYYNGSPDKPINAGTYIVTVNIADGVEFVATSGIVLGEYVITPKPVTVTAVAKTKIYGSIDPVLTYSVEPTLVSGDAFSGALSRASGDNVGKYAISQGTLNAGNNYNVIFKNATFAITPKSVTIIGISTSDKVYDGNATAHIAGNAVVNGVIGIETVTVTNGTASFADKNVGNNKIVTFKDFGLSGTDAGNYTLSAQPASTTANITAKPLTVNVTSLSAKNKVYDGTTTAEIHGTDNIIGEIDGDVVTIVKANASFNDKNVGTDKPVTFIGFDFGGADVNNYDISVHEPISITAKITPKPVTITGVSAANKMYDGSTNATITGTATISGKIDGDAVTVKNGTASFDNANVGTRTVTFSGFSLDGTDAGNYTLSAQPASVTANITAQPTPTPTPTPTPPVADKCGTSTINYDKQFCYNDKVYSLCNGSSYDPESERCSGTTLQYKCGKSGWYNEEKQFCWEDEKGGKVYSLCGGSSYDPEYEKCQSGEVVSKTTPVLPQSVLGNISVKAIGNTIMLSNLPQGAKVEVYSIQGKLIFTSGKSLNRENRGSDLVIGVQTKGMYIVKVGTQTLRVAVR